MKICDYKIPGTCCIETDLDSKDLGIAVLTLVALAIIGSSIPMLPGVGGILYGLGK